MGRLEFESTEEVKTYVQTSTDLTGAVFQNIDLSSIEGELAGAVLRENVLLGCSFSERVLSLFDSPLIFPLISDLPFNPFRSALYSPEELLGDYVQGDPSSYENTLDSKVYQHYLDSGEADASDVVVTLARRLHDHGIQDALQEFLEGHKVVAIMGGHSMRRDDPVYLEVAKLSRELVNSGYLLASGGGPGAMEATHLGAWFSERSDDDLVDAVSILSSAPSYSPIGDWLEAAFQVRAKYALTSVEKCRSLGIPTWLYGHEPPTPFATHIAKYFANSVREEGLLAIAMHGVIFAPGSAGTIQEVFQDAAQNHYKSFKISSPMIFLGHGYWKWEKPVFPLLSQLAAGYEYSSLLAISDSRKDIVKKIKTFTNGLPKPEA